MMGIQGIPMIVSKIISTELRKSTEKERRKWPWNPMGGTPWILVASREINQTLSNIGLKIPQNLLVSELLIIEEHARKGTGRGTFYMVELIEEVSIKLIEAVESKKLIAAAA
jgi:hypothetical protein